MEPVAASAAGPGLDPALGLDVDLDLAQVRAFAAVADERHFGRAAARLGITQQALSKRVARLEATLGVRLFERGTRGARGPGAPGVEPTEYGVRFLEPARQVLDAGRAAVLAVRDAPARPLRIDVWGHLYAPLRTVAALIEAAPALDAEPGAGRDYPAVAEALMRGARGGADAGFGRVHALPGGDAALVRRLVRLEPVDAVLSARHPLAGAAVLRPADLRDSVLRYPAETVRLDFLTRFADRFGVAARAGGPNLGLESFLARLREEPASFTLFPADVPLPDDPGLRVVPLVDPTPLYAWSLVWPAGREHPGIAELLRVSARLAAERRWLDHDPVRDWLPDTDRP
ncbi:LysR family transcriptional regulator [Streptomyces kunmingensis]|uniref:LysR family transcriptional regulator n=1 Tax=Streptomyces kunmingensis TaxID=68225 RepID=A0ABU6CQ23_9ACTN|nr:LysR family transcriptional regulator [Streptomyces kunmingensis]MEB3966450.1 LysR family transcriptional regulator [Streptomyces kunmingensis]